MKKICLIGQRFGRLTVIEAAGGNKSGKKLWKCQCDCGEIKTIQHSNLRSGGTKSCGCLRKDTATTHGMTGTPTFKSWDTMIQRCNNRKTGNYKRYGKKGITVCDRWLKFENFFADMGERPEGKSIDRINSYGNYESSNCRWATPAEQSRNTRLSRRNKTGAKGVHWDKRRQKYCVQIAVKRNPIYIGRFDKLEAAVQARKDAELKYWGTNP
jgi:hypothetical protein